MADDVLIEEEEQGGVDGTIVLMLGLYLIVLAFFILLNAISEISEEKVEQATQSVAEGFGFQLTGPVRMRDDVDITINPVFDVIAKNIENVLETYVSVKDYKLASSASKMVLRVNTDKIFQPGDMRVRPAMVEFFNDLADIVGNPKPGMKMVADVRIVGQKSDVGDADISVMELTGRRATLFARALAERGVKPERLSAGAIEGDKSEIQIYFEVLVLDMERAKEEARKLYEEEKRREEAMKGLPPAAPSPQASGGGH